jgi:hypothetical protein
MTRPSLPPEKPGLWRGGIIRVRPVLAIGGLTEASDSDVPREPGGGFHAGQ